jgi:adhesin/invasin
LPPDVVRVTIRGRPATVTFAGLAPGFIGLCQVNLIVPAAASGEQALEITMDGAAANSTVV